MPVPVVVVDDDHIDRYLVGRLAEKISADAAVIEFATGNEFCEVVADHQLRCRQIGDVPPLILVLLDINMPGMNGFEVLDELAKNQEITVNLKVVMHTSSCHPEDVEKAKQFKFVDDYVEKPLSVQKLDQLVQRCLV